MVGTAKGPLRKQRTPRGKLAADAVNSGYLYILFSGETRKNRGDTGGYHRFSGSRTAAHQKAVHSRRSHLCGPPQHSLPVYFLKIDQISFAGSILLLLFCLLFLSCTFPVRPGQRLDQLFQRADPDDLYSLYEPPFPFIFPRQDTLSQSPCSCGLRMDQNSRNWFYASIQPQLSNHKTFSQSACI